MYALPFYGESSFTMYNKAMFDEAGLEMPEQPTWEQIAELRLPASRSGKRPVRHRPARSAWLGSGHGAADHRGQHLWRRLVRHGVDAPDRHA